MPRTSMTDRPALVLLTGLLAGVYHARIDQDDNASLADDRVILVWLDLVVGRFVESRALRAEVERAHGEPDAEATWEHAAQRLWFMAQRE